MTCTQAQKLIPLMQEIGKEECQMLQGHVQACPHCRVKARQFEKLSDLAGSMPPPPEPPGFYDSFAAEVQQRVDRSAQEPSSTGTRLAIRSFRPRLAYVLAIAAATVFIFLFLFQGPPSGTESQPLEAYLLQNDYRGLVRAISNEQQRSQLVYDYVSLDLLISSIEKLQRLNRRYGQIGFALSNLLIQVKDESPVTEDRPAQFARINLGGERFDFRVVLNGLLRVRRQHEQIRLIDLVQFVETQGRIK